MTPYSITRLRDRVQNQPREQTMRIIACEIMEHHHLSSAHEIAKLLLDAAGVEVGP
jgi:hypothetical protein